MNFAVWKLRFEDYLRLQRRASSTLRSYTASVRELLEFLEGVGVTALGEVGREQIEEYRAHLYYRRHHRTGKPLSAKTQGLRLVALRTFFRFLVREDYLLVDPTARLELPKNPEPLLGPLLTESEMVRLLEAPDVSTPLGLRDRTILELLYSTAVRNAELWALRLSHLDLGQGELRVVSGKGDKSRVTPLGETAGHWLERYLAEGRPVLARACSRDAVFLSWRGRRLGTKSICDLVKKHARAAGLTKRVTPHHLRHCCATHMLRRGAGLRHLQSLLGHATVETTQRYTRVEISDLRQVHRRCHPRERARS